MKYLFFITTLLFPLIMSSCEGDQPDEVINVRLSNDELYRHFLGYHPIEGGYTIAKHPKHSIVSEIEADINEGVFYLYAPENDFTGTDEVEIHRISSIGGGDDFTSIILIQFIIE